VKLEEVETAGALAGDGDGGQDRTPSALIPKVPLSPR